MAKANVTIKCQCGHDFSCKGGKDKGYQRLTFNDLPICSHFIAVRLIYINFFSTKVTISYCDESWSQDGRFNHSYERSMQYVLQCCFCPKSRLTIRSVLLLCPVRFVKSKFYPVFIPMFKCWSIITCKNKFLLIVHLSFMWRRADQDQNF